MIINSENFRVTCKIYLADGTVTDISDYIYDIIVMHSLQEPISEVSLVFQETLIYIFKKEILYLELIIENLKFADYARHTDRYLLVPQLLKSKLSSPTLLPFQFPHVTGVSGRVVLSFYIKPCYEAATYTCGPVLTFQTTIPQLIDKLLPPNCEKIVTTDLNEKLIPQIYIRRQPFINALRYLSFFFGISSGPVCTSIIPDVNDAEKSFVIISDVHQNISEAEYYDKTFIIRVPTQNVMKQIVQELEQDQFVVDFEIDFNSEMVPPTDYTVVSKPYSYLHKIYKFSDDELINNFGTVYLKFDRKKENSGGFSVPRHENIIEHSGFDFEITPITSMLAYDYTFATRGFVNFEEFPNLNFIWPGEIVQVKVENPDYVQHAGLYLVESVLYRLTRDKTKAWQNSCEVTIVRSNLLYEPQDITRIQTTRTTKLPETLKSKNLGIKALNNIKEFPEKINSKTSDLVNYIDNEFTTLENQDETKKDNISSLYQELKTNYQTIFSLQNQIINSTDINEIQNLISSLEDNIQNIENKIQDLDEEFSDFDTLQNSHFDVLSEIDDKFNLINSDIVDLDSDINNLKKVSEELQNSNEFLLSFINNVQQENSWLSYMFGEAEGYQQDLIVNLNSSFPNIQDLEESIIRNFNQILSFYDEKLQEYHDGEPYDSDDIDWIHSFFDKMDFQPLETQTEEITKIIDGFQNIIDSLESSRLKFLEKLNISSHLSGIQSYISTNSNILTNILKQF